MTKPEGVLEVDIPNSKAFHYVEPDGHGAWCAFTCWREEDPLSMTKDGMRSYATLAEAIASHGPSARLRYTDIDAPNGWQKTPMGTVQPIIAASDAASS